MPVLPEEFFPNYEAMEIFDADAIAEEKLRDAQEAPGYAVAFDPPEAERAGAYVDDVVTDEEALAASADIIDSE